MNRRDAKIIALKILMDHKEQILEAPERYVQGSMAIDIIEDINKVSDELEHIFDSFKGRIYDLENNQNCKR